MLHLRQQNNKQEGNNWSALCAGGRVQLWRDHVGGHYS